MDYSYGIYGYFDTEKNNKCVYIGQDSHIDKNQRHKQHHYPSQYDLQAINRILQNNPGRYEYKLLEKDIDNEDELNELEKAYIKKYDTYENGFNYTEGGEGTKYWLGKIRSVETRIKMSETKSGKKLSEKNKKIMKEYVDKMTDYEKLLKKYKTVTAGERYRPDYRRKIRTQIRIKNRHLILDELLLEAPFNITKSEKKRIRYMIDNYHEFNKLNRRVSEECIILAFIFFIHKLKNTKRVPEDYRICNKYCLTDRKYSLIVTRLANMIMEQQPLRGE